MTCLVLPSINEFLELVKLYLPDLQLATEQVICLLEDKKQASAQIEDFPMSAQQNEEFGLNQSLDLSRQSNSEKVKEKVNKLFTKQPFWKK